MKLRLISVALAGVLPCALWADEHTTHECLVEPSIVTEIGTEVQGVLESLLVDRGETVSKGQPLVQLASTMETLNVEQARTRAQMRSEINARKAELMLSEQNLERINGLHEQNLVTPQDRDEARARHDAARAALAQALDAHKLAQVELARAEQMLAQNTILSPIDGVVVEIRRFPGEFVYDKPLMTVAQLDPLRVEVILPGDQFGRIRPGDVAEIRTEFGGDGPLQAMVDVVDAVLDTRSGTFGVRLLLPNADYSIVGGQRCQVVFDISEPLASDDS